MSMSGLRSAVLVIVLMLVSGSLRALEDCTPYLEQIDAKIAGAQAAGQNVEIAEEMRGSISEICTYLDAATLQGMVDGLDALLPAMSDAAGVIAEAEAAAAQAKQGAVTSSDLQVPVVVEALPVIGQSLGGGLVDRPDAMHQFGIWDMDVHQGKARVVYHTRPDRLQFARPDWEFVTYVAEVDQLGGVNHHLIDRRQSSGQDALALRRGFDEIVVQWQLGDQGRNPALERWSVRDRSLLSKVAAPMPRWPGSEMVRKAPFLSTTDDGNLFYIGTKPTNTNATEYTLAWYEASPGGEILSRGMLTREESLGADGWALENRQGGSAALLMVSALDAEGIESRLQTPIRREVAGRHLHANVHMEKRLLVVEGSSFWESPALERMLLWDGEMSVPQNLPGAEMLRQSQAQMAMMADAELEYGSNRTVSSLDVGLKRLEMVKPMRGGRYAVLMRAVANRSLNPAVHGQYLFVVDRQSVDALVYLEPLAEALEARFTTIAVSPTDQIYLVAVEEDGGRSLIVRVDQAGAAEGLARADAGQGITLQGLVADETGVWAFGRGLKEGIIGDRIWIERFEF